MAIPKNKNEYHDSAISRVNFFSEDTLELEIDRYSFFYKKWKSIRLRFTGIFNTIKVRKYFAELLEEPAAGEEPVVGIECFHYDEKKTVSREGFILLSQTGSLRRDSHSLP